jgi:hypothetical protein
MLLGRLIVGKQTKYSNILYRLCRQLNENHNMQAPGDGHYPLIWPETLNRSRQSSLRVPACKTIKRLPLPEGIFGASDPSFGSHMCYGYDV